MWEDFRALESNTFLEYTSFRFLTNQWRSSWLEFHDVVFRDSRLLLYLKGIQRRKKDGSGSQETTSRHQTGGILNWHAFCIVGMSGNRHYVVLLECHIGETQIQIHH